MPRTLILATGNPGKVIEIKTILRDLPVQIKSLADFPPLPEVVEDGATLEHNALKKAREIFQALHLPALADDSGLEVYALGMKPGVYSARYAGEHVSYADNNRKLLAEMRGIPSGQRRARFRCVIAFIADNAEKVTEGVCEGTITREPRGSGGFGYDPLFVPDGYRETFGELPIETKNQLSHRSKALILMRETLRKYFQE
jgi:XTP/dITP diphosphohydrolase